MNLLNSLRNITVTNYISLAVFADIPSYTFITKLQVRLFKQYYSTNSNMTIAITNID